MKKINIQFLAMVFIGSASSYSYSAPGVDTIQLSNPVEHLQLPINGNIKSQGLDEKSEIPINLKAKIARYEAKSFSGEKTGISTDEDVSRTVTTQANRKTCIQDVGSNTGSSVTTRPGGAPQQQIVVLRGDLVNVCK